jgi:hypothetical protein
MNQHSSSTKNIDSCVLSTQNAQYNQEAYIELYELLHRIAYPNDR